MNKRILRYMSLLALATILFFSVSWGFVVYTSLGEQLGNALKNIRVSLIDASGGVLFDNMSDPSALENHLTRPEVEQALRTGFGESERYSETLGEITHYYSVMLPDNRVLRLALSTSRMRMLLTRFVPLGLLCAFMAALLSFGIARRLTRRIVAPINRIDLNAPQIETYDELLPLIRKIESQKREISAQVSEIEKRSELIVAITRSMKEGLLMFDERGLVLLANESAHCIFSVRDAVGKSAIEICRQSGFVEAIRDCLAGENRESELSIDGRIYAVYCTPFTDTGGVSRAVALLVDVTDRHVAETHRKEFSANVSHELKTPLTTIAALSEMMANGTANDADLRPFAGRVNEQAHRLINIIREIMRLSEFDEGRITRDFSTFNLYELAETVLDAHNDKAAGCGIALSIGGNKHCQLTANRGMIDELLYNLIDNAIKYNRAGGSVAVLVGDAETSCMISVADTGIGIPSGHVGRIFERFYRVDASRSKKTGGSGLGLSIVKHIAEFHGGHIGVQSEEGVGTTVICTLPIDQLVMPE